MAAIRPAIFLLLALLLAACGKGRPASPPPSSGSATASRMTGCASGQAAGASVPAASGDEDSSPSELHVNRTETFYDVTGRSWEALLEDLTQRGPRIGTKRHFGRTAWTARWEIAYARPAAGSPQAMPCRMQHADVYMDVEVTLPRWDAPGDAPASLRRDWKSFVEALAFHEREHQESIISAGRRVVRALETLKASSCSALQKKANAKARPIIEEARDYNRRYDERTDHGRTQGARWPLR